MNRLFLRDFLTGLTALAALAGIVGLLIFFGEITPQLIQKEYEFQMRVANAGGLDDTSPVLLNGVKVGQVKSASVTDGREGLGIGAVLRVGIKPGVSIPKAAKISVDKGFVGGASLEFTTRGLTTAQAADPIQEGDIIDGGSPETLMDSIRSMVQGPAQQFSDTAKKINDLAEEWTRVGRQVNDLVAPRTLAEVDSGKPANVSSSLARLDSAFLKADNWLNDADLKERVESILSKADNVMQQATDLTSTWKQTGESITRIAQDVSDKASKATEDISTGAQDLFAKAKESLSKVQTAGEELSGMIERVNQGQGTVGQLVTNPQLYQNLDAATVKLDKALAEAQLVLEKLKAEGIKLKVGL